MFVCKTRHLVLAGGSKVRALGWDQGCLVLWFWPGLVGRCPIS